jgi:hypothetical protein
MKPNQLILLFITSICVFTTLANAQEGNSTISKDDNSLIDKLYLSRFVIDKKQIDSEDLRKVFSGSFVEAKAGFSDGNGTSYCRDKLVNINDGKVVIFDREGENLIPFLNPDFTLASEADAESFNNALDRIVSTRSGMIESVFLKKANKWHFIRDEYWDSEKGADVKGGFIVTVDQKSKITSIDYSNDIEKSK